MEQKGLVILNTGDGKGKTTAALGLMLRAWGWNKRVCMIQFLKNRNAAPGEIKAARKLEWNVVSTGDGFTWKSKNLDHSAELSRAAWEQAKTYILSGEYDVIALDEFTYPLSLGWLDVEGVIDWLRINRPKQLHLVITGRQAPQALIDYADLVTEMRVVKHPFEKNVPAQAGIEF